MLIECWLLMDGTFEATQRTHASSRTLVLVRVKMLRIERMAAFGNATATFRTLREGPVRAVREYLAEIWLGGAANDGSEPLLTKLPQDGEGPVLCRRPKTYQNQTWFCQGFVAQEFSTFPT
mgnify:CR=1 FL=1